MIRWKEQLCREERLRHGAVYPGEENALGRSDCSLSVLEGGF